MTGPEYENVDYKVHQPEGKDSKAALPLSQKAAYAILVVLVLYLGAMLYQFNAKNARLAADNGQLTTENKKLAGEVKRLKDQVEDLQAQLDQARRLAPKPPLGSMGGD